MPPFKLGEPDDVGLLDAEGLLVMTREKVLLPLTVTMVVVTTAADSVWLAGAAVVVIKAVGLFTGADDCRVDVGVSLVGVGVGVGVGDVEGACVVDAGVDDAGAAGEDGGREVVVAAVDCDCDGDADADADSTAELDGAAEEEGPVPTGLL